MMRNLSMLTPIFYIFFIFCLFCHICAVSASTTPRYIAVDNIALSCGTRDNSTARDQREWIGDIHSKFAPVEEPNHKSTNSEAESHDYVDAVPYKTARISYSQFMYEFVVTPGPKFVRLHFNPVSYPGFEGSRDFFTVKAGSFTLLRNFSASIYIHANSLTELDKTLSMEFCINVEKDQKLNLTFIPISPRSTSSKFYAFINGIEILSMPKKLYYDPEGPGVPYVGQNYHFSINYEMALEKVFRLNVGGGFISAVDDTGMFREWSQDTDYTLGGGVTPHETNLKPIFSKVQNYTAPDAIYKTAVSMGPNRAKNLLSNLTWRLPVDSGFNFLVRLHFCEISPQITKAIERPFIIYIDNKTAEENADVILWSGRGETPVYKDYVVRIQDKGVHDKIDLLVALHPKYNTYAINDAILNGMEVFKLSNSDGNLAVAGPDPKSFPSQRRLNNLLQQPASPRQRKQ
jgi:hypothetical protein